MDILTIFHNRNIPRHGGIADPGAAIGSTGYFVPEFLLEFWAGLGNGKYGDFPAITLVIIW